MQKLNWLNIKNGKDREKKHMKVIKSIFSGRCCDCGDPATTLVESAGYQYKLCDTCLDEWKQEKNETKEQECCGFDCVDAWNYSHGKEF
jgi:hypothetical protein